MAFADPEAAADCVVDNVFRSVNNTYKITEKIGFGTFGEVVLARRGTDSKTVAMKFSQFRASFPVAESTILHELRRLRAGNHHIVEFHDTMRTVYNDIIVMERLDESLFDYFRKQKYKLRLNDIRPILVQILLGLSFLHRNSFIHADIKPENIMFIDTKLHGLRLKIIDFGWAYHPVHNDYHKEVVQSRNYRAPEVFIGYKRLTSAIDIWSLVCIAVELFCGDRFFPGESSYDMVQMLRRKVRNFPNEMMSGRLVTKFFDKKLGGGYEFKRIGKFKFDRGGKRVEMAKHRPKSPESASALLSVKSNDDIVDRTEFVEFVKFLLILNPAQRPTAQQALDHKFFTYDHLMSCDDKMYADAGWNKMISCGFIRRGTNRIIRN